jgi:hypothetical protein
MTRSSAAPSTAAIADAELATAKAVVSSPKTARSSAGVGKYRRRRMELNGHEQGYCIFSA